MLKVTEFSNAPKLTFSYEREQVSIPYPDIVLVRTAGFNSIFTFVPSIIYKSPTLLTFTN